MNTKFTYFTKVIVTGWKNICKSISLIYFFLLISFAVQIAKADPPKNYFLCDATQAVNLSLYGISLWTILILNFPFSSFLGQASLVDWSLYSLINCLKGETALFVQCNKVKWSAVYVLQLRHEKCKIVQLICFGRQVC